MPSNLLSQVLQPKTEYFFSTSFVLRLLSRTVSNNTCSCDGSTYIIMCPHRCVSQTSYNPKRRIVSQIRLFTPVLQPCKNLFFSSFFAIFSFHLPGIQASPFSLYLSVRERSVGQSVCCQGRKKKTQPKMTGEYPKGNGVSTQKPVRQASLFGRR